MMNERKREREKEKEKTEGDHKPFTHMLVALTLATAGILGAPPAAASADAPGGQNITRMGWQPYLGCWKNRQQTQTQKTADTGAKAGEKTEQKKAVKKGAQGILCFIPTADPNSVEALTIEEKTIKHRETITIDDRTQHLRESEQDACTTTEWSHFSSDEERIYITSDVTCGDQPSRHSTGIMSAPESSAWVDVRATELAGRTVVWSRWYHRVSSKILQELEVVEASSPAASSYGWHAPRSFGAPPITVDDVIDAVANVNPSAVDAWIAEVGPDPFPGGLKAKDIKKMHRGGVPSQTIDIVIAVNFPQDFALAEGGRNFDQGSSHIGKVSYERRPRPSTSSSSTSYTTVITRPSCWDSYFDPFGYYYHGPYGYSCYGGYYYPRYSYGYRGHWGRGYSGVVIRRGRRGYYGGRRDRRRGYNNGTTGRGTATGAIISGQGYRRRRPPSVSNGGRRNGGVIGNNGGGRRRPSGGGGGSITSGQGYSGPSGGSSSSGSSSGGGGGRRRVSPPPQKDN